MDGISFISSHQRLYTIFRAREYDVLIVALRRKILDILPGAEDEQLKAVSDLKNLVVRGMAMTARKERAGRGSATIKWDRKGVQIVELKREGEEGGVVAEGGGKRGEGGRAVKAGKKDAVLRLDELPPTKVKALLGMMKLVTWFHDNLQCKPFFKSIHEYFLFSGVRFNKRMIWEYMQNDLGMNCEMLKGCQTMQRELGEMVRKVFIEDLKMDPAAFRGESYVL